jgi:hypothetical protein
MGVSLVAARAQMQKIVIVCRTPLVAAATLVKEKKMSSEAEYAVL